MIAKALTLSGNHGPGLDKDQGRPPPRPAARNPGPKYTVSVTNAWALGCSLIHRKLMSQCDDLELQREPWPEHSGHKCWQRTDNGLHGSGSSPAAI